MTIKLNWAGYEHIPEHTKQSLAIYVVDRIAPGGFLTAVLENDLFLAVSRADSQNIECLPDIVKFIYNRCPMGCHGSKEAVDYWLSSES